MTMEETEIMINLSVVNRQVPVELVDVLTVYT